MSIALAKLAYKVGSPGMVATHTYAAVRQMMIDSQWINNTAHDFRFGTAAVIKAGVLDNAQNTAAEFVGVFVDNCKYIGKTAYTNKEMVNVLTMGDIWVKINPALTVIPFLDKVSYIEAQTPATTGDYGVFTNAAPGVGVIAVPNARFLTNIVNGMAVIGIGTWKGN